ncbi:MAG: hypothetical protein NC548_38995 [Lachnospiraceae bacterium]|nr:hypothetical protein [Lachnospiraceae bacterium]
MVQYVMRRVFFKGHVAFALPNDEAARESIRRELEKCRDRHHDHMLVTLQPPKKPRTTGEGSQNHHLNGHIMQICNETGNDYDTIKYCVKMVAVEQMGYPYKEISGHILPQPERECSTEECAKLIEAAHVLAAELGIILQE